MGCDISLAVEVRRAGQWHLVLPVGEQCDPGTADWERHPSDPLIAFDWYTERNYRLFAMLADVKNYSDIPITPIAEPRGLPDDLSPGIEDLVREGLFLGHIARSYLTLAELLAYDWGRHEGDQTYAYAAGPFYTRVLPELAKLGRPADVRIVFGFDG